MNISPEQLREKFEAWLAIKDPRSFTPEAYDCQAYKWKAWQAAFAEFQKLQAEQEPVAVIGDGFQMLWCRQDWSNGLRVGDRLYAATPDLAAKVAELEAKWLAEQATNLTIEAEIEELAAQNQALILRIAELEKS